MLIESQISADEVSSLALRCDPSNVFFHNNSHRRANRFIRLAMQRPIHLFLLRLAVREGDQSGTQSGLREVRPVELFEEFAAFFEVPVVRARL